MESAGAHSSSYTAKADAAGSWQVQLRPQPAALDVSNFTVSCGAQTATIERVLFGDLLLCGGQSNMQFSLNLAFNGTAEIAAAGNYRHNLRLLTVEQVGSKAPVFSPKLKQPWSVSSPSAVDDKKPFGVFSAECYLTGRMILDRGLSSLRYTLAFPGGPLCIFSKLKNRDTAADRHTTPPTHTAHTEYFV